MPPPARRPQTQAAAPPYAERAWRLADLPVGGTGARLNTAKVVDAAVQLADEGGLAGLSIRHLAQRLGLSTMAVYRHVDSRDQLVVLMVDVVLGPPPSAGDDAGPWPDALLDWGTALYQRYEAHPWALDAPIPGMPSTPNLVHWLDRLLGNLEPTGLPVWERLDVALLIAGHVRHIANVRLRPTDPGEPPEALWRWLPTFVTPERFPFYSRIFDEPVSDKSGGPDLDYGLHRIIDGVRAHCRARGSDTSG